MGQLGSLWLDLLVYEDGRPSSHCLSSFQNCILCLISVAMHYICYTEWAMYTQRVVVEVFVEIRSSYASGKNWQSAVRKKEEDFKGQSTQKCFIFLICAGRFHFHCFLIGDSVRESELIFPGSTNLLWPIIWGSHTTIGLEALMF